MAEEITEQELMALKLHGEIKFRYITIQRVMGGWIYWKAREITKEGKENVSVSCALAGVFVPKNAFAD